MACKWVRNPVSMSSMLRPLVLEVVVVVVVVAIVAPLGLWDGSLGDDCVWLYVGRTGDDDGGTPGRWYDTPEDSLLVYPPWPKPKTGFCSGIWPLVPMSVSHL